MTWTSSCSVPTWRLSASCFRPVCPSSLTLIPVCFPPLQYPSIVHPARSLCFSHREPSRVTSPPLCRCCCLCWGLQRHRRAGGAGGRLIHLPAGGQINTVVVWEEGERRSYGRRLPERQSEKLLLLYVAVLLFLVLRYHEKICIIMLAPEEMILLQLSAGSSAENKSALSYSPKFFNRKEFIIHRFVCKKQPRVSECQTITKKDSALSSAASTYCFSISALVI